MGIDAGERVSALVQKAQHVFRVSAVAVTDERHLGLFVGVERTGVMREEFRVGGVLLRLEGVPRERLAESRDLGVDQGQFVRTPPTKNSEQGPHHLPESSRSY
ncbi:hypothetical protein [Actinomadura sp. 9N407]|uniref:hypothetical protein n=1 Tax=Actinomadura sp. 9N407 TaxID=3375154 RepID=UPI0037BC81AA